MKCEVCGRGPKDGLSIYRVNAPGEDGRWVCDLHKGGRDIDPETIRITKDIEKALRELQAKKVKK